MAEPDLSKIVNLIMENPKLIEEIKGLAEKKEETLTDTVTEEKEITKTEPASTYEEIPAAHKFRRRDLLSALKPYVSEERGKAIDSMLSISDILDMMKVR